MEENKKAHHNNGKNISDHILPTASNLLGLCFVLLSFIKLSKLSNETMIDELLAVTIILLLASSLFSYTSIRAKSRNDFYEKIADLIFLSGLVLLSLISLVIAFEFVS